jgi:abhydrolase domain-containing protein 6
MKKVLKYLAGILALMLLIGLAVFFFAPEKIIQLTNWNFANQAQLEQKSRVLDNYTVHYYQSKSMSKAKTLVLLHGMGDDKSSFLQSAKKLSEHYNLVLPDLNGHGDNAKQAGRNYSIKGQTELVHAFLQKLGINQYFIGGNSMGGHTALAYTLHYPTEVQALVLVNAPGVTLDDHVVYGGFGQPMKGKEDLDKVMARVFYKAPSLPGPIANYMISTINSSLDFVDNTLVPSITQGEDFDLKNEIQNISAPTLILWGKHDIVVKANVAAFFDQTIPNSTLVFLENGAHSPQLEIPNEVAEGMVAFLEKLKM